LPLVQGMRVFDFCVLDSSKDWFLEDSELQCRLSETDFKFFYKISLKVVTNEKGEAVGDVLTIIC
jgi:hypothetical protein